jgi:DNA-binding NarL/FixJ family response regulator
MPGHIPSLDDRSLARLRRCLAHMPHCTNGTLPIDQLVQLAGSARLPVGVTIDLRATKQLGTPLVVVRVKETGRAAAVVKGLSERESQVCALIAEGLTNKVIASRLFISIATVKDHVHKILQKTGAPNRAAVAVAYREAIAAAKQATIQ